jgi:hypothetical protein
MAALVILGHINWEKLGGSLAKDSAQAAKEKSPGEHWGTCQAQVRRKTRLWSRNHLPLEPKFPTIREAVNQLKLRSTIMDGEIAALDENSIPS